ncbi:MAG TPA: 3'-5' exonuclease [Candidatus Paceibacterota bacterium]
MKLALPPQFVLFDTEYTAWEGSMERKWSNPGEYREVIQFGAVKMNLETLVEECAFSMLVRPVKNPELSAYITTLTGITQEDVDTKGVPLAQAMSGFAEFIGELTVFSYGHDAAIVEENCRLIGIPYPFKHEQFLDIRPVIDPLLEELGIDPTPYTSGTLIQAFNTAPGARAHDAVNDMRNLLDVLRELRAR